MFSDEVAATIGPIAAALRDKGFERLTPVQEAVLEPELDGRDLRISSQTGSGKTVAIGLAVRKIVADATEPGPRVLVITPVRELARQVEEELKWLYAPVGARTVSVTGGAGYRDELRALKTRPAVVVGTPGRLRDHLERQSLDPSRIAAVVLDEADRMLDMGFVEEVEAIISATPEGRRTHLVSATFPREVKRLADRFQNNPAIIEATPLGAANQDIEHIIHLVQADERLAALVNLLLLTPGAHTLIFARTRADVAEIAEHLNQAGFVIGMLSGEMEQNERNRALAKFKSGRLDALVATDVAARGIDVADVARVIHAEPPGDADAYTHRSGRTGRAGKKGASHVLVRPTELGKTQRLLERARVRFRFEVLPSANAIRDARDEHLHAALTADAADDAAAPDDRDLALAKRLADLPDVAQVIARLIARTRREGVEPRDITPMRPPQPKAPRAERMDRADNGERPQRADRFDRPDRFERPERSDRPERPDGPRGERPAPPPGGFVPFRVSWGRAHGADPRRLVAMLCRRGGIDGRAIGAIRVGPTYSIVEVAAPVAEDFEKATKDKDPRDPRIMIRRWNDGPPPGDRREDRPPPPNRPAAPAPPPDRPSRSKVTPPADRPSRSKVTPPPDRPSRSKVTPPPDRPSRTSRAVPQDRPSRAGKATPAERPSRRIVPQSANKTGDARPKRR